MANVMTVEMRSQTEQARDDVKATLSQATLAAQEFRREMYALRDSQIRARESVTAMREAFHSTQQEMSRARENLRNYNLELSKAETAAKAAVRAYDSQKNKVDELRKKYDEAQKAINAGTRSADTKTFKQLTDSLSNAEVKLKSLKSTMDTATGTQGYYRRQVNQTNADIGTLSKTLEQHKIGLRGSTDAAARLATSKSVLSGKVSENNARMTELRGTLRETEKAIKDDDRALNSLAKDGMGAALIGATLIDRAFRMAWVTIKDLIIESTKYAGRTVELQIALENVGRVQGYNVGQLRAYEDAIKSLGITTQDARKTLLQFAQTGLNLDKAPQLARVAQDLAVVAGVDTSEEINRLVAGVETLQIRALRTAGVFVSLEGELNKAALASHRSTESFSEQEKQQILLNAVLDFGSRATGTYEQAMTTASKQMRTMNRLWAEMQNAVGSLFQGPFGLVIDSMSFFLKLVTNAPGPMLIFGGAVTLLVGKIALNTLANAEWASSFRAVAASIGDATRATFGMQAAQSRLVATTAASSASNVGSAAAARASTGASAGSAIAGGLSKSAIGIAVVGFAALTYAIYKYATATREATFANQENVRQVRRQIEVNNEDIGEFRKRAEIMRRTGSDVLLSDEQRQSADREQAMALMRLDPLQRKAIENDKNRASSLESLATRLDAVNAKLRGQLRELNRQTVAALPVSQQQIDSLLARAEKGRVRNEQYNQGNVASFLNEHVSSLGSLLGLGEGGYGGDTGAIHYQEDVAKAQGAIEARRNALQGLAEQVYDLSAKTKQSTAVIIQQEFGVKRGTSAFDEISAAVSSYSAKQNENNGVLREAIDLNNQIQRNLQTMKLAQFDVSVLTVSMTKQQQNLQMMLTGGIALGYDWNTVVGGSASAIRAYDDDLAKTSATQDAYNKRLSDLDPIVQKAIYTMNAQAGRSFERFGEAANKAAKRLNEVRQALRQTVIEIADLREGGGDAGRLEQLSTIAKRELDARRRLGDAELQLLGAVQVKQPDSAEELDQLNRTLQDQLSVITAGREALFAVQKKETDGAILQYQVLKQIIDLQDIGARTEERRIDAGTAFYKIQQDRISQEKQILAEITAQSRMRSEEGKQAELGLGRTRLAYLALVRDQQKASDDAENRLSQLEASRILRSEQRTGVSAGLLDAIASTKQFDVPNVAIQHDIAFTNPAATEQQRALDYIQDYTKQTAENTAQIAGRTSTPATSAASAAAGGRVGVVGDSLAVGFAPLLGGKIGNAGYAGVAAEVGAHLQDMVRNNVVGQILKNSPDIGRLVVSLGANDMGNNVNSLQAQYNTLKGQAGNVPITLVIPPNATEAFATMVNETFSDVIDARGIKTAKDGTHPLNYNYTQMANLISNEMQSRNMIPSGTSNTNASATVGNNTDAVVTALRRAIFGQESGYKYGIVNPHSGALGFGQVMPGNVASWTKGALGQSMTPNQFLNDPNAQVAVADWQLGNYLRKQMSATGGNLNESVRRVASSWYGGEDDAANDSRNKQNYKGHTYPSFHEYRESVFGRFEKEYGQRAAVQAAIPNNIPTPQQAGQVEIDTEETRRRLEANRLALEKLRPPVPSNTAIGSATYGDYEGSDVVRVTTNDVQIRRSLTEQLKEQGIQLERLTALNIANVKEVVASGETEIEINSAVFNAMDERYKNVISIYKELMIQRKLDSTGFQESEEHKLEVFAQVELSRRREANETKDRLLAVQKEIEEINIGSANRIRLAYMEAYKGAAHASEGALTRIASALPSLERASRINLDEVAADVTDWLNQQQTVSQVMSKSITGLFDNTLGAVDTMFDRLIQKTGVVGSFLKDFFGGLMKVGLTNLFGNITKNVFGDQYGRIGDIITGKAGDNAVNPNSNSNPLVDWLTGSGKQISRMEIQSAGQVIINAAGAGTLGSFMPTARGTSGLPSVLGSAINTGAVPTNQPGVYSVSPQGVVTNGATGYPVGAVPGAGTLAGSGLFGVPAMPGGTATFTGANVPFDVSSILGNAGGAGIGGTNLNPQSILQAGGGFAGVGMANVLTGGLKNGTAAKGFFNAGIGSSLAMMLPGLGGGLGGSLGGQSGLGSIFGQVGGTLAGLAGMSALMSTSALTGIFGSSIGGFLGGASAIPILAPIAGALLIGAYILGRNKKRREAEKQRDAMMGDSLTQLNKLLRDVQRDRIDGASAIAQAETIRAQYMDAAGKLPDKKTRNIAIKDVSRLDLIIQQIKSATVTQDRRRELDNLLVPEFNNGGRVRPIQHFASGGLTDFGGRVPGTDFGYDSVPAMLRPGEVVLTRQHQQMLGGHETFRRIQVPGFYDAGGAVSRAPMMNVTNNTTNSGGGDTFILVADEDFGNDLADKLGGKLIKLSAASIRNKGEMYGAVRTVKR